MGTGNLTGYMLNRYCEVFHKSEGGIFNSR